jgi:aspartate aminotransferase
VTRWRCARRCAEYTVYVDGISKAFAATGVRVGWAAGPADVMAR